MKSFFRLLLISLLLTSFYAQAQTNAQGIIISGATSLNFSNTNFDADVSSTNITLLPSIGFFVVDNLALGLELQYFNNTIRSGGVRNTSESIGLQPFAQVYFAGEDVRPYLRAGAGIRSRRDNDSDAVVDTTASFAGGVSFFVSKVVSFDAEVAYSIFRNNEIDSRTNTLGLGLGISVFL